MASQKFTWPVVSCVIPVVTVAVSTTTLPAVTVVTALPPEVTARVVLVDGLLADAGTVDSMIAASNVREQPVTKPLWWRFSL